MRSNYKLLGNYIQEINKRDTDLKVKLLLGVSIQKKFIPSIANIIGTDMSTYKIIKKNQFAYGPVTSRNGDKISIALLQDYEEAIISQAYYPFEIIDTNKLLPEYLMMWFRRPEFDRYARFMSHGSAREIFSWEELMSTQLPIPHIDKQKEIVKEYNILVNRITLNNQLIQKLEETAQAIYKQWFVDFEFPDEEGKGYKSNGGEMLETEVGEIPKEWNYQSIQTLIDANIIYKNQDGNHGEIHPTSSDYVSKGIPFIMARDIFNGTLNLNSCSFLSPKQAKLLRIGFSKSGDVLLTHKGTMGRVAIVPTTEEYIVLTPQVTYYRVRDKTRMNKEYLYCLFRSEKFQKILNEESDQSTRKFLSILNQRLIKVLLPSRSVIVEFGEIIEAVLNTKRLIAIESMKLTTFHEVLLSKLATIKN